MSNIENRPSEIDLINEAARIARTEAIEEFKKRRAESAAFRRTPGPNQEVILKRIDAILVNLVTKIISPKIGVQMESGALDQQLARISAEMAGLFGDVVTCMCDCRKEIAEFIYDYCGDCLLSWFTKNDYPGENEELQRLAAAAVLIGFSAFFKSISNPPASRYIAAILGMHGLELLEEFESGRPLSLEQFASYSEELKVLGEMSTIYRSLVDMLLDLLSV